MAVDGTTGRVGPPGAAAEGAAGAGPPAPGRGELLRPAPLNRFVGLAEGAGLSAPPPPPLRISGLAMPPAGTCPTVEWAGIVPVARSWNAGPGPSKPLGGNEAPAVTCP